LLFTACHPLVNPVDPRSTTYVGTPTATDPDATAPLLPPVAKWELVAYHGPGSVALPLEITDDDAFIEPRDGTGPGEFELWMTLSDSFSSEQTQGVILWITIATVGSDDIFAFLGLDYVAPEQRRLGVRIPTGPFPSRSRARLRLTDANGTILGERVLGYLIGDVDGNGVAEAPEDHGLIIAREGFAPTSANPNDIRADIDLNGVIEGTNDWSPVGVGDDLPAEAPPFLGEE
jgi:hypothetical protein